MEMLSRVHAKNLVAWAKEKSQVLVLSADLTSSCEAELFRECLESEQSKALIHVFFGEREVAKKHGAGVLEADMALAERLSKAIAEGHVADLLSDTLNATDLDILAIHACGYPRHLGGPLWAAGIR